VVQLAGGHGPPVPGAGVVEGVGVGVGVGVSEHGWTQGGGIVTTERLDELPQLDEAVEEPGQLEEMRMLGQ